MIDGSELECYYNDLLVYSFIHREKNEYKLEPSDFDELFLRSIEKIISLEIEEEFLNRDALENLKYLLNEARPYYKKKGMDINPYICKLNLCSFKNTENYYKKEFLQRQTKLTFLLNYKIKKFPLETYEEEFYKAVASSIAFDAYVFELLASDEIFKEERENLCNIYFLLSLRKMLKEKPHLLIEYKDQILKVLKDNKKQYWWDIPFLVQNKILEKKIKSM